MEKFGILRALSIIFDFIIKDDRKTNERKIFKNGVEVEAFIPSDSLVACTPEQ